jgi:DNA polymerase-3 subunit delta'
VVGHAENKNLLWHAADIDRLPSTMVFSGPDGVGRKKLAMALAQRMVCEKPVRGTGNFQEACGACPPCLRTARVSKLSQEQISSEAVLLVAPEKAQITIDQVRAIQHFTSLSLLGKSRMIIVDEAQSLNLQAANAFLKLLEEPPPQTYFVLLAPTIKNLIPTIRSRAQNIPFYPLPKSELKKHPSAAMAQDWMLSSAQGSFQRLEFLLNAENEEARLQAVRFLTLWLEEPANGSWKTLSESWKSLLKDRLGAQALVDAVLGLLRDAVLLKAGVERGQSVSEIKEILFNSDQLSLLEKISQISMTRLVQNFQKLLDAQAAMLANRDPVLVLESYWFQSRPIPGGFNGAL